MQQNTSGLAFRHTLYPDIERTLTVYEWYEQCLRLTIEDPGFDPQTNLRKKKSPLGYGMQQRSKSKPTET